MRSAFLPCWAIDDEKKKLRRHIVTKHNGRVCFYRCWFPHWGCKEEEVGGFVIKILPEAGVAPDGALNNVNKTSLLLFF